VFLFVVFDADWQEVTAAPDVGARAIGDSLLSTWAVPFELASVLLTAALVGAIVLVRARDEDEAAR
jgi:NADH:ubiquinone oxidoreductase subunit 6 (subunit J)